MAKIDCAKCGGVRDGSNAAYCRLCYNKYKREWYQKNAVYERARCAAWNRENSERHRANVKLWRENNPEKTTAAFKSWRARNKDRVRIYDQTKRAKRRAAIKTDRVSLAEWQEIKSRHRHRCAYCGGKKPLTMDHVIPLSKGGRHIASNIAPACRLCNGRKTNMSAEEFAQRKLGKLI